MIKLIPLVKATKPNVQTPSRLEETKTVTEQEFGQNYKPGNYHPISQDASGDGKATVQPTFFDKRNGMLGSFLASTAI